MPDQPQRPATEGVVPRGELASRVLAMLASSFDGAVPENVAPWNQASPENVASLWCRTTIWNGRPITSAIRCKFSAE